MSQFEDLLRETVLGVGQAYDTAEQDLFAEVAAASEAVEKVTNGEAVLQLEKTSHNEGGSLFGLYLLAANGPHYEIGGFSIPPGGYPVRAGSLAEMRDIDRFEAVLRSRQEINDYFKTAMSTPNSRLVLRVAFLMRSRAKKQ